MKRILFVTTVTGNHDLQFHWGIYERKDTNLVWWKVGTRGDCYDI